MLTRSEFKELVELIQVIDVSECFGVGDVMMRCSLESRATEEQVSKAYSEAYRYEGKVKFADG